VQADNPAELDHVPDRKAMAVRDVVMNCSHDHTYVDVENSSYKREGTTDERNVEAQCRCHVSCSADLEARSAVSTRSKRLTDFRLVANIPSRISHLRAISSTVGEPFRHVAKKMVTPMAFGQLYLRERSTHSRH
jgi:hypothetical protein